MEIHEDDVLHYGILRKSGRYPWGSGANSANVVQRSMGFQDYVESMKASGLSEVEIAKGVGMTTTELRATRSIARNQIKQDQISRAQRLKDKGYSNVAIGEKMGLNESSVRALLAPGEREKADALTAISDMLRQQVAEKTFVDVGKGVSNQLGISDDRLNTAISMLRAEGYEVHTVKEDQAGTAHKTTYRILVPPGVTQRDVFLNKANIQQINSISYDNGRTNLGIHPPLPISLDRVGVVYGKKGSEKDGVMYVRPGVDDVTLGAASYAQVRVQVGKTHYLKGMAMYSKDMPDGVDILFHTNKDDTGNKLDALKKLSDDPDNPFGAVIKAGGQRVEYDRHGKPHVTSVMNILNEEGDWGKWSRNIASQVLSKQSPTLAKRQLAKAFDSKKEEFDEIMAMTNPVVKKKLLEEFADSADSASVHLKAAALPRQSTHIILPIPSMPEHQVYAPNYKDGETVVLIRYPHAGRFEIPELTVNNSHATAKRSLGQARDAIGIHPKVAEKLSGADFDGDTVLVIPNGNGEIKAAPALEKLRGFDPKKSYPKYDGMPVMTSEQKGLEMGRVSNLITDMTIRGASPDKIARAVRHSMVVIDAEKHELDYRRSAIENGIPALMQEFQGRSGGGASTLISRAKSKVLVPERKARTAAKGGPIDPETGQRVYEETGATRTTKSGDKTPKLTRTTKLAETQDAHTLSSGTIIETIYADHSNSMKALANRARLESLKTPPLVKSPSAAKVYEAEVRSLNAKLDASQRNAPLERQAQIIAAHTYRLKKQAAPDMDPATRKKVKGQALQEARNRVGAERKPIIITDSEWAAIQAGAISTSRLSEILDRADSDRVKALASPRSVKLMDPATTTKAKAMLNNGATRAEVAEALGVSLTTLDEGIN